MNKSSKKMKRNIPKKKIIFFEKMMIFSYSVGMLTLLISFLIWMWG